jgi:GTP-binding protein EngB required for normal cell division
MFSGWGKIATVLKSSEFFKGNNLKKTMEQSLFGKIKETLLALFTQKEIETFQMPKVIVIGNESTGKSSLLENITKCQLFPRDSKLCTKCPVRVCMASKGNQKYSVQYVKGGKQIIKNVNKRDDLYGVINEYMNSLPADHISDDVLTVTIVDNDMPDFEMYDLPGIRTYPPDTAEKTMALCRKYLSDKNSIVLCVVPATTTRLTSSQSIALITETKMEKNCILALTMADRLQPIHIEDLLVKRIIGTSDELVGLNFAGYVAVINRLHTESCNLEEHDEIEKQWFDSVIIKNIPPEYKKYEEAICTNVRVDNLILKMNELYKHFFENNWIPRVLSDIQIKIANFEKEYIALGHEKITDEDIKKCLDDAFSMFTNSHQSNSIEVNYEDLFAEIEEDQLSNLDDDSYTDDEEDQPSNLGYDSYADFYEKRNFIAQKINSFDELLKSLSISEIMKKSFKKYKLIRFENAIKNIEEKLSVQCKQLLTIHKPTIERSLFNGLLDDCMRTKILTHGDYSEKIYEHYKLLVLYPMFKNKIIFDDFDRQECDEFKKTREMAMKNLTDAREHYKKMESVKKPTEMTCVDNKLKQEVIKSVMPIRQSYAATLMKKI